MNKRNHRLFSMGVLPVALAAVIATTAFATEALAGGASAPTTTRSKPVVKKTLRSMRTPVQSTFNRLIVRYKDGTATQRSKAYVLSALNTAATRAGVAGMRAEANGRQSALSMKYERQLAIGAHVVKLSHSLSQAEVDTLLTQLRADPAVKYAQPDYTVHRFDFTPNDPRFDLQWHYTHPTAGINAPVAWDASRGEGVVVAVVDTGYVDHSDLNANLVPGYDFVSDLDNARDGDGRDADARDPGDYLGSNGSSWHGTHVAGTVAAVTNNGLGLAGVAFNAKVQPVRVMGPFGGSMADIIDAITWASGGSVVGVPNNPTPAEVINMSLGGFVQCSQVPAMQAAITDAVSRGVTVVVASGNSE